MKGWARAPRNVNLSSMSQPVFQPTLVGPTVTIRPMSPNDWRQLFVTASDPEIWKVHPAPDRYTEPVFRKFFDGAIEFEEGLCVR